MFNRVRLANGLTLSTANTHFGGPRRGRPGHAVVDRLADLPGPQVLMGDVNAGHDQVRRWLSERSVLELAPRPTALSRGYRQSDHIAVAAR